MPKRYGSRGTIITTDRNTHTSQTGSGSSSRRTSYGDPLSKKWENRTMRDPESSAAQNIDAVRKSYVMHTLGVTTQGRMDRLKQALTHPSGSNRDVSYQKARSYDDVLNDQWEERRKNMNSQEFIDSHIPKK